jgi:phage terminase Nu1 subunit (DNA packaging protein)
VSAEPYIDAQTLAELMGVSTRTVKRWVVLGCPSETWGMAHVRRFRASEVMAWARERSRSPTLADDNLVRPVAPVGHDIKE